MRRPSTIPPNAPTVSITLAAGSVFSAICRQCRRTADIDLAPLEQRGLGNVKLLALQPRMRCTACGALGCDIVVSGRYPAPF